MLTKSSKKLTKGDERVDEWLSAVNTAVSSIVKERVGGGTTITHGKEFLKHKEE